MSHPVTPDSSVAGANGAPIAAADLDARLDRARRILSGDVRAEDYLSVNDEVRRLTDREMEYARSRTAPAGIGELEPSVERRQLEQNMLLVHCRDQHVAYLRDENGIVILITGLEETAELLRQISPDLWSERICLGYVDGSWQLL